MILTLFKYLTADVEMTYCFVYVSVKSSTLGVQHHMRTDKMTKIPLIYSLMTKKQKALYFNLPFAEKEAIPILSKV